VKTEGETTFRAFDGEEVRTFYHWWVPTLDDRPDYARSQLLLVDLSDIKRAEDALATERERLSVTLRAMTEGVITVDMEGTVQFINEAAEKLTGWSAGRRWAGGSRRFARSATRRPGPWSPCPPPPNWPPRAERICRRRAS